MVRKLLICLFSLTLVGCAIFGHKTAQPQPKQLPPPAQTQRINPAAEGVIDTGVPPDQSNWASSSIDDSPDAIGIPPAPTPTPPIVNPNADTNAAVTTNNPDGLSGIAEASYLAQGKRFFQAGYYRQALNELLPLAADGNAEAQYAVGYMYYYGYGVAQDTDVGYFWICRSARQGYRPAQEAIRLMEQGKHKKFRVRDRYKE